MAAGSYLSLEKSHRTAFSRQPCHVLLVDCASPFDHEQCSVLCQALGNFFAVACNLGGPNRLPLFSLYVVHKCFECLLPFIHVKGSFPRIQQCLAELRMFASHGDRVTSDRIDELRTAIQHSMTQFRQHLPLRNTSIDFTKCSYYVFCVKFCLSLPCSLTDFHCLCSLTLNLMRRKKLPQLPFPEDDELLSFIDFQPLDCTATMLEGFFKAWLHDCETDWEHLHLIFPPLSSRSAQGKRITLKCDMQETMLSPPLLPGTSNFSLTYDLIIFGNPSSFSGRILQADGLCESVLYGLPLVVKPTSCWKLEWEDLESNRRFFHALCHTLQERQQFLLTSYETISAVPRKACPIRAYYVLLPSRALTMLVKAVASAELLLPCEQPMHAEDPAPDALRDMQYALDQLEVTKTYNPLQVKSLLDRHLQEAFGKLPLCNIPISGHKRQQLSISFQVMLMLP
uniref:Meiosis 1 associated protein n=1 Tax=Eptatretus burgeri TaxID=7764 RepID=A0A8C4QPV6_EPTBU